MGTLNHPQTSHVVMPMNSEARDMGVLNKHMLSTTIRFFKSNIIFYMIWLIQNTSIAPIPAQLLGVQVDWHPGGPLQVIVKGNLTAILWIFWHCQDATIDPHPLELPRGLYDEVSPCIFFNFFPQSYINYTELPWKFYRFTLMLGYPIFKNTTPQYTDPINLI